MGRENDRIDHLIGCIPTRRMPATLIASSGHHCEVWRSSGTVRRKGWRSPLDIVIKIPRQPLSANEAKTLQREHGLLRKALGEIVPPALFVRTRINGVESLVAMAPTVSRWFDLANPAHEEEAAPLLSQLPEARHALRRFVEQAELWYAKEEKVIDLYGLDNLVLDRNRQLRYIDSFGVFFYADLLHLVPEHDATLAHRIDLSRRRLAYLQHLLSLCEARDDAADAESAIRAAD
ncbi:MAG: hypothetical protein KGY57_01380 [Gammaproteobacteria bacterium]|nr:hypothetical protein [Gammaproteobacteria bacterium]